MLTREHDLPVDNATIASNAWDERAVTYLRESAATNQSLAQIAQGLQDRGYSFTRSAVIAKLKRLGITHTGPQSAWCDEAIEILRRTIVLGSLAAQTELGQHGYDFTRKAICGKARRLGLIVPRASSPPAQDVVPPHTARQRTRRANLIASEVWANRPDDAPLPDSNPVNVIGLRSHHCRWPLGRNADDHRLFCGAVNLLDENLRGSRYCATHFILSRKETSHGTQIQQVVRS